MSLIAIWLVLRKIGGVLGAAVGWLFADWRRIAVAVVLAGYLVTYIVADHRRADADAIILTQRLEQQQRAFDALAMAAQAATEQHWNEIGVQVEADFEKQMSARDAADAKKDAALAAALAVHNAASAGKDSGIITEEDLPWLTP